MIKLESVSKRFMSREGTVVAALRDICLSIQRGEFFTLLGPSGCGKSTTLRCIAGLETPDSGRILIGEQVVYDGRGRLSIPTHKRNIGMVFQSYAIWPHMTVFENVAYPLKLRGTERRGVRERVEAVLGLVGLRGLERRPAPRLSGGQQQRVAVARALVAEPEVLLMDEPLSNLDAKLREEMRRELRSLQQKLGITVVYVTHDQQEALALADRIAVMDAGTVVEVGTPEEVYYRPQSLVTARFIGTSNSFSARLTAVHEPDTGVAACEFGPLHFTGRRFAVGDELTILIRPEVVSVKPCGPHPSEHPANVWKGVVKFRIFVGNFSEYVVDIRGTELRARVDSRFRFQVGDEVLVSVSPEDCLVFPAEDHGTGHRRMSGDKEDAG